MTENFVLALGGTGSRCAEALAYVCACGAIREPIRLLVLDPDEANGNRNLANDQLQRYHAIHAALGDDPGLVFSTPVNASGSSDTFVWGHPRSGVAFRSEIGLASLENKRSDFLSLLFDDSDLDLTFTQGYVGKAHVGSVDQYRLLKSTVADVAGEAEEARNEPLHDFLRALRMGAQSGARLIVIGSIFGGTGASVIPILPRMLREALEANAENVTVGCIQLTPYFVFPESKFHLDPDSTQHPLAARAALLHYSRHGAIYDRIYVLGAPEKEQTNKENRRGGMDQANKPHYVEIAAALAVADFFARPPKKRVSEVAACGRESVDWPSLPDVSGMGFASRFAELTTLTYLHERFLDKDLAAGRLHGAKWWQDMERDTGGTLSPRDEIMLNLRLFCRRFLDWASEVNSTVPGTARLFEVPEGSRAEGIGELLGGTTTSVPDAFHDLYARLDQGGRYSVKSPSSWYLHALSKVVTAFCSKNYDWWRAA